MKSLIVILDESAPSFCYYEPPPGSSRRMEAATLSRVVAFAQRHELGLQVVCGGEGLPSYAPAILQARPYTCYFPAGAPGSAPEDIPVVQASDPCGLQSVTPGKHAIAVLRAGLDDLPALPRVWESLSERVYRIVLVMRGLDQFDGSALERYAGALLDVRQRLAARYLAGAALELNVLSDRLALVDPVECGAGLEHSTVLPSGALYLCPGFAFSGQPAVGDLESGWQVPNQHLLEREHAPICSVCDAFHCRRCVWMNQRATLEVNTPPWQLCGASHREREASRQLLAALHERRCMENLPPIPPLDYDDPLALVVQTTRGARQGASARRRQAAPPASGPAVEPGEHEPSASPDPRLVGRVTAEERDRIRELYYRKNGLAALLPALARMDQATLESSPLYDRIVRDMGVVTIEFQAWWDSMAAKYAWHKDRPDASFRVDFETCEVHRE